MYALLVLLAAAPLPAPGATPTPDPCAGLLAELNRPTVGFSPCAAERGATIVEAGWQHETLDSSPATSQTDFPQAFVRFGLAPRFELDLDGPDVTLANGGLGNAHGFHDTGLACKYEIDTTQQWQLAIDALYAPPNGAPAFTAGRATYAANVDAAYSVTSSTSLGATLSLSSGGVFTPSVLVLQQFDSATQAYVEYVNVSHGAGFGDSSFVDVGMQRLVGQRVELDVEYGHALTGVPAQRFEYVGAGFGLLIGPAISRSP